MRWREEGAIPPATKLINSPSDPEARFGKKRTTMWTGYNVHLTETGEENLPPLITPVATTPAPRTDEAMTEVIQSALHQAELSPQPHLLDCGYVTSHVLVSSQKRFGIEIIGPAPVDVNMCYCITKVTEEPPYDSIAVFIHRYDTLSGGRVISFFPEKEKTCKCFVQQEPLLVVLTLTAMKLS